MAVRKVVQIDEDKCDGCGLCVPGCAEGALQIVDGKAKLVSDVYCDGLGACLGECPRGAITLVEREADAFDEEAVSKRLEDLGRDPVASEKSQHPGHEHPGGVDTDGAKKALENLACGCPGTLSQKFEHPSAGKVTDSGAAAGSGPVASRLGNWPVQIMLVPPKAPYLDGADLLIAADCAPFAYGDFHRRFLEGRTLLVGCPKLDDTDLYLEKLASIFRNNDVRSIGVVYMEVPCCGGLVQFVKTALENSSRRIPVTLYKVGIRGDSIEERILPEAAA